jgi:hypothetical protein
VNHDTIAHVTVLSAFVTGARPTVSGTASTDISSVNVSIGIYLKSGNNIVLNTTVTYNSITVSSVNGKLAASIHRSGHGATVEA